MRLIHFLQNRNIYEITLNARAYEENSVSKSELSIVSCMVCIFKRFSISGATKGFLLGNLVTGLVSQFGPENQRGFCARFCGLNPRVPRSAGLTQRIRVHVSQVQGGFDSHPSTIAESVHNVTPLIAKLNVDITYFIISSTMQEHVLH